MTLLLSQGTTTLNNKFPSWFTSQVSSYIYAKFILIVSHGYDMDFLELSTVKILPMHVIGAIYS